MSPGDVARPYDAFLGRVPRRTNDSWLGDVADDAGVYVCGHKFLLHLEGTSLAIWTLIDGRHTAAEMADEMCRAHPGADRAKVLEDTAGFLIGLEALGLAAWRTRPLFEDVEIDE